MISSFARHRSAKIQGTSWRCWEKADLEVSNETGNIKFYHLNLRRIYFITKYFILQKGCYRNIFVLEVVKLLTSFSV